MKTGKKTIIYFTITAIIAVADLVLAGLCLYYYIGQMTGKLFLPTFFTPLCIVLACINVFELIATGIYIFRMKK